MLVHICHRPANLLAPYVAATWRTQWPCTYSLPQDKPVDVIGTKGLTCKPLIHTSCGTTSKTITFFNLQKYRNPEACHSSVWSYFLCLKSELLVREFPFRLRLLLQSCKYQIVIKFPQNRCRLEARLRTRSVNVLIMLGIRKNWLSGGMSLVVQVWKKNDESHCNNYLGTPLSSTTHHICSTIFFCRSARRVLGVISLHFGVIGNP